jgi:hypothetical protein
MKWRLLFTLGQATKSHIQAINKLSKISESYMSRLLIELSEIEVRVQVFVHTGIGSDCSIARAARNTVISVRKGPTNCTPIGNPLRASPQGTEAAGCCE